MSATLQRIFSWGPGPIRLLRKVVSPSACPYRVGAPGPAEGLLEALSPEERAVFMLRELFMLRERFGNGYPEACALSRGETRSRAGRDRRGACVRPPLAGEPARGTPGRAHSQRTRVMARWS